MLTRCTRHDFYEIGDVMSPEKKSQKSSPGKRPGRLFEVFDENSPTTTNTSKHANLTSSQSGDFPRAVLAAEPATPTEKVAKPPSTIQDVESAVPVDNLDALHLREKRLDGSDEADTTASDRGLEDEEIDSTRAGEQAPAASFQRLLAMGFDGKEVFVALAAANGDENVAVDYLLSGVLHSAPEEVDLGDPSCMAGEKTTNNHDGEDEDEDDEDDEQLSQEERERLVLLRTRSKGFSEEEIASILYVFRQDRMAALDLELEGPSSAGVTAPPPRIYTDLILPPQASIPQSTFRPSELECISPFTNGYVDPQPTTNERPPKRPLDTSSDDTVAPAKKHKKRRRAPTPPRYKGLTREEYMRRRFG